jgi:hypothetical protein
MSKSVVPLALALVARVGAGAVAASPARANGVTHVAVSGRSIRMRAPQLAMLALLPLANACLLSAFVFGEDSYRDNGISRWQAYGSPGGALGPMFVLSLVLMATCAVPLGLSTRNRRARLFRASAFGGGVAALLLITPTIIGTTTN